MPALAFDLPAEALFHKAAKGAVIVEGQLFRTATNVRQQSKAYTLALGVFARTATGTLAALRNAGHDSAHSTHLYTRTIYF